MDITVQLDSPFLRRLLDVVASGVGAVFRPWMIRRLAQADADAMLLKAKAEWDVRLLELPGDAVGQPTVLATPEPETVETDIVPEERIRCRLRLQEEKRQRNIEFVVWHAASDSEFPPATDAPDDDWVARFFSSVQDVSSDQMQTLWGRILAGEIRKPGSYSLRTLDLVRNLSPDEAQLLTSIAGTFEENSGVLLFGTESGKLFPRLNRLVEAGLLHPRSMWRLPPPHNMVLQYHDGALTVTNNGLGYMDRFDPTQSAGELLSVIKRAPLAGYLDALVVDLRRSGYTVDVAGLTLQ